MKATMSEPSMECRMFSQKRQTDAIGRTIFSPCPVAEQKNPLPARFNNWLPAQLYALNVPKTAAVDCGCGHVPVDTKPPAGVG
jgi:hypothetical protein